MTLWLTTTVENKHILDKIWSYCHKPQRRLLFSWVSFDNNIQTITFSSLWAHNRQGPSVQPPRRCWRSTKLSHAMPNKYWLKQPENWCGRNLFISIHMEFPWTVKSDKARFVVTSFSEVFLIPRCRRLGKCCCCCCCCREQLEGIWERDITRCVYRCYLGTCWKWHFSGPTRNSRYRNSEQERRSKEFYDVLWGILTLAPI